ncbi:MAG: hypothetical protein EOP86_19695 [Verrucomicrobiaceae bacterium]|nr:MAG: hypothetical protein EOP86_19695 [Verrucomicrobiaceae bacterium]
MAPLLKFAGILMLAGALSGCGSHREEHQAAIGRTSSFTGFTISLASGRSFAFSSGELRAIEALWNRTHLPGNMSITNELMRTSRGLQYSFTLSDGYTESGDAYFGKVSGSAYLYVVLEGDGGGFMADVYGQLLPLASVLSAQRLSDLAVTQEVPANEGKAKMKGEQAGTDQTPPISELDTEGKVNPESKPEGHLP